MEEGDDGDADDGKYSDDPLSSSSLAKGKRGRPRKHAPKIPLPPLYVFIREALAAILIFLKRTLIKKKIKFSSYIRKFRVEQLKRHI